MKKLIAALVGLAVFAPAAMASSNFLKVSPGKVAVGKTVTVSGSVGNGCQVGHTGDVATSDDDGYITYVGRTDDVFKASDYRISPFELESVLLEHGAVAEAAVVPSPDPLRLAVPKAYVVLTASATPGPDLARDILSFCRERVAPYKRIRRIEFGDLPKTVSGKIRRVELRARETEPRETRGTTEWWEEDL